MLKMLHNPYTITLIVILGLLFLWVINTKFRRAVYVFISKAEIANISKDTLFETVDKIQNSDLDDRMVYVIVEIIRSFPLLSLIPRFILVKFLNFYVQKAFNGIKILLDTKRRTPRVPLNTPLENPIPNENYEEVVISKGSDMAVENLEKLYAKFSPNKEEEKYPIFTKVDDYIDKAETVVTAADFLGVNTPKKAVETISKAKEVSKKVENTLHIGNDFKNQVNKTKGLLKGMVDSKGNIKEEEDAN